MNASIKKTNSYKNPTPLTSSNIAFTPTKRFPVTSPVSIISNAKLEIMNNQEMSKSSKKPMVNTPGINK